MAMQPSEPEERWRNGGGLEKEGRRNRGRERAF